MALDSAYMRIRMALLGGRQVAAEATAASTAIKGTGTAAATSGAVAATASRTGWTRFVKGLGFVTLWAKRAGAALTVLAGYGLFKATNAAVDLGEQINKTKEVFEKSSRTVLRWSKDTNTRLGLSQEAALEYAGTFGNMLVPMGFARGEAAKMSQQLVDLSADMASFNNTTPEEALEALRAGLAGETEPLRRYGVFLNDARVAQESLGDKTATSTMGMTEQEKAMGRLGLIMSDTKDAQGDFLRTSDSLANQQRILSANLTNLGAKIGKMLIPPLTDAAKWLNTVLQDAMKGKGPLAVLAGAVEDVVTWVKGAVQWIKDFWDVLHNPAAQSSTIKDILAIGNAIKDVLIWAFQRARGAIGQFWSGIKNIFGGMARVIGGVVKIVGGILRGDWGRAWEGAKQTFGGAVDFILGVLQVLTAPFRAVFSAIGSIVGAVFTGILDVVKSVLEFIIDKIEWAIDKVEFLADKAKGAIDVVVPGGGEGLFSEEGILGIPGIPIGAKGFRNFPGGLAVVGEEGPELVNLPRGSDVYSNPESREMLKSPSWADDGGPPSEGAMLTVGEKKVIQHITKLYVGRRQIAEAVADEIDLEKALQ